jgi:acetyl-CoA carboxylase beta subunit
MTKAERLGARDLLDAVLDPGSWQSWDTTPQQVAAPGSDYADELVVAEAKAGTDESLITGQGTLQGRPVAVVVSEFRFLAGSIGHAAAERLVLAVERATRDGLPLTSTQASRIWSICAIPRPAGCWPPGGRRAT